jgi:hypothetical protein
MSLGIFLCVVSLICQQVKQREGGERGKEGDQNVYSVLIQITRKPDDGSDDGKTNELSQKL